MKLTFQVMNVCELKSYFMHFTHINIRKKKESYNSLCNRLYILLMDKYQ